MVSSRRLFAPYSQVIHNGPTVVIYRSGSDCVEHGGDSEGLFLKIHNG